MKLGTKIFISLLFFMIFINSNIYSVRADEYQWNQYRLNPNNNAVIKNDILNDDLVEKINTNNEVRSTPVVVGENIFIGNHESGEISAYNLTTGELLWENQAPNWIHSEIIYVNKQLFVGYGNRFMQENGMRGTGQNGLLSLDPETGEILWDFETEGEVMPTPAFYKDTVYITTGDKSLYGINPKTGEESWSLNLNSVISMSSPNIKDGILYVGGTTPSVFFAVDLDKKKMKWEKSLDKVISGLDDVPPVVSEENFVYTSGIVKTSSSVSVRDTYEKDGALAAYKQGFKKAVGGLINKEPQVLFDHILYAIDGDSGEIVWEQSLGEGAMVPNNKSGAPILYKDKLFVGSPITESFYGIDATSGNELWKYESNINKAPPVADNDIVYFTDTKGLVYGFDTESGSLIGKKLLGGKLAPSGPILVNDYLIVGSQDHNVYITPIEDILQSNDKYKNISEDKNSFSYIALIYILPLLVLVVMIMFLLFLFKRIRSLKGK